MKPATSILSDEGVGFLCEIAFARALLAFDYDGALAPRSNVEGLSEMRPETRTLLQALALLYPCAVLSHRARSDLAAHLEGIALIGIIGGERPEAGLDPFERSMRSLMAEWQARLEKALGGARGVEIENRGLSLALHYRHAPSASEARRAIGEAVAQLGGAIAFDDQAVVNVLSEESPTKAIAIRRLCERFALKAVVYVGKDRSEDEAFRCDIVTAAFRIGVERGSHARFGLSGQAEMDELLRALVVARAGIGGQAGGAGIIRAMRRELGHG